MTPYPDFFYLWVSLQTPYRKEMTAVSSTMVKFFRKPSHVQDLEGDTPNIQPSPCRVIKVIELTERQYRHFAGHLLADASFIAANRGLTGYDEQTGVTRCLLVTARIRRDGILVDSQGYDYARYAAYVQDKEDLDLREVPVDHYNLKPRERHTGRDR